MSIIVRCQYIAIAINNVLHRLCYIDLLTMGTMVFMELPTKPQRL